MPIEAGPLVVTPPDGGTSTPTFSGRLGTSMRLVDPKTERELFAAGAFTAVKLNELDLGYPDIRESVSSLAGQHGTYDTTRFFGARGVTAKVTFPRGTDVETAIDSLTGLLAPGKRLYLYCQRPNWDRERRLLVRPKSFTCPPGIVRVGQVQWQAPHGLLEDSVLSQVTLVPTASVGGGFLLPFSFPLSFDNALAPGAALIPVGGNIDATPVIDIYGPCSDPQLVVFDTGERLAFKGLDIADGDYVRVDMRARAVFLNGDPDQSRYSLLDFARSTWWTLPPGDAVTVGFSASNVSGACQAVVAWRSAWVGS